MASYLIAKRIDEPLANDIGRSHNSHRHGDLYRSSSRRQRPVTCVTFIRPHPPYIPYIDRKIPTLNRGATCKHPLK